jgi:hypothetical protein
MSSDANARSMIKKARGAMRATIDSENKPRTSFFRI